MQAGQEYELPTGHIVRPFPTVHTIPSQVLLKHAEALCSTDATGMSVRSNNFIAVNDASQDDFVSSL